MIDCLQSRSERKSRPGCFFTHGTSRLWIVVALIPALVRGAGAVLLVEHRKHMGRVALGTHQTRESEAGFSLRRAARADHEQNHVGGRSEIKRVHDGADGWRVENNDVTAGSGPVDK